MVSLNFCGDKKWWSGDIYGYQQKYQYIHYESPRRRIKKEPKEYSKKWWFKVSKSRKGNGHLDPGNPKDNKKDEPREFHRDMLQMVSNL